MISKDNFVLRLILKQTVRAALAAGVCALALTACSGASTDGKGAAKTAAAPVAAGPDLGTPISVRLITEEQYFNTLGYVFGPEIRLSAHFAPLRRTEGLLQG